MHWIWTIFQKLWNLLISILWQHVFHYNDVIMSSMASQIPSLMIVYSAVYSGADQRKHQSSTSLAFVRGIHRGPVNSTHKGPVMQKMFPFGDIIMWLLKHYLDCLIHGINCFLIFSCDQAALWMVFSVRLPHLFHYVPIIVYHHEIFRSFYTPVWKTGRIMLWQCLSVRPSAFSGLFFNMLWDINLKLSIYIQ